MYSQHQQGNDDEKKDNQNQKVRLRPLNWSKPLKKGNVCEIFIWGKARPHNMFPQNQNQLVPWKCDNLSNKQIRHVCAAKEGHHCFGIGKNDWCYVWGETKQIGALGLGNNSRSTSPFLIKTLSKQRVKQACCSAVHSLCITDQMVIYGWGNKLLTLLDKDTIEPVPLNYLNGKGLKKLVASNTHSFAWKPNSTQIYSFGIKGPWLGLNDDDNQKVFGLVQFDSSMVNNDKDFGIIHADCSSQYSLFVLNTGYVGACGINEHGRMGVGKHLYSSSQIVWNIHLRNIVLCSAASFHSGFVDANGNIFTCGIGLDYRLGHGDQNTLYEPKHVKACDKLKICQIECVDTRSFVITTDGDLVSWGKDPIDGRINKLPFIYNYLQNHRIYDICAASDFVVAIGVNKKESTVNKGIINYSVDSMKPNETMGSTNNLVGHVLQNYHPSYVNGGQFITNVFGNFVGDKQVKYDNNHQPTQYGKGQGQKGPPINTVYGGNVSIPPPPQNPPPNNGNKVVRPKW